MIDTLRTSSYNKISCIVLNTEKRKKWGVVMATIHDIAKIAGVSTSTVSHVVNHTRYVSPELISRVEAAIEQLDDLPNFITKKNHNNQIALCKRNLLFLISDRNSEFQYQVEKELEEIAKDKGYKLFTAVYDRDCECLEIVKNSLLNSLNFAGIIAFPDESGVLNKEFFGGCDLPIVFVGREIEEVKADVILLDTFDGAYKATRHLIKNGHEHIAFLGKSQDFSAKRFSGYQKALDDYHIQLNPEIYFSNLNYKKEIFEAMDKMMNSAIAPTAVVAANGFVLLPLLEYLNTHNIIIPKDLSVVSLNDFSWTALFSPSITCIDKKPAEIAEKTFYYINKRIEEKVSKIAETSKYEKVVMPIQLNVRESTCGIGRGPFGEKAENADALILSETEREIVREKKYTAAISLHYTGKAWMQLLEKGVKKIFDDLGISLIATTDAHFDASLQCKQLESLLFLKPDVLIAIPVDKEETAAAFQKVAKSGTKLVLITNIPEGIGPEDYISCVSVNEHSHGRNMGHGLGEYMLKHNLSHVGLIRHGDRNFYATQQRDDAAEQVILEEFPEVSVSGTVDFLTETEVFVKTVDFIKHHPETEALYVSWDGPAMEVLEALVEVKRTDIAVVTGDLDYPVAMNMAKGGMIKMLSAQCPYEQGEAIALAAANGLLGKNTPSFIGIEPVCVTQENLLKSWLYVFKEEAPGEMKQALRHNPNYIIPEKNK